MAKYSFPLNEEKTDWLVLLRHIKIDEEAPPFSDMARTYIQELDRETWEHNGKEVTIEEAKKLYESSPYQQREGYKTFEDMLARVSPRPPFLTGR
jgi:hypothetical protein